ncbi:hypothetical protein ACFY1A_46045, partial [Streptomyces sp. NPDC001520]|uniref:hypothetical protein n=1 Tax=Streptomyces sp. NPDC001520 TaxID=3364581 RepID=UPI00367EAFBF
MAKTSGVEDLTEAEAELMIAESLLQLLDLGGEQALLEALLAQGRAEAETAIGAALASGHLDQAGLDTLRRIADGPRYVLRGPARGPLASGPGMTGPPCRTHDLGGGV